MKRGTILCFLALLLLLMFIGGKAFSAQRVTLQFFYMDPSAPEFQCPECGGAKVLDDFVRVSRLLTEIQKEYGSDKVAVQDLDIRAQENYQLFAQYGLTKFPAVVAVSQFNTYPIVGDQVTDRNLKYVIDEYLAGRTPGPLGAGVPLFDYSALALSFSLGFFSGFSPCLMAMLAFILTYSAGTSHGLRSGISKAVIFAVGLVTAVTLVGLLFLLLRVPVGDIINFLRYFTWIAAGIMIVVGLSLVGVLKLPISTKSFFQKLTWRFGFSSVGLFSLGFLFYFVKVHCAIPFFMILLTQVPVEMSFLGMLPFIVFGVGVVTPFLIIGIVGGGAPKLARQVRERYRDTIRAVSGMVLIGYAIWLIISMGLWPA